MTNELGTLCEGFKMLTSDKMASRKGKSRNGYKELLDNGLLRPLGSIIIDSQSDRPS